MEVTLQIYLSKVGTDKDKEVAVYKLKIDDDGFAADRYTTTVRLKLDGYTVWNGRTVFPDYK